MSRLQRLLATPLTLLALWGTVRAQEQSALEDTVVVEVRVTDVSSNFVFLDAGRLDGLREGDEVRLQPSGSAPIDAVVVSLSASSSRAELVDAPTSPPAGTFGEVRVPIARLAQEAQEDAQVLREPLEPPTTANGKEVPAIPEHPPWEAGPVQWSEQAPLLAGVAVSKADERAPDLHGRVYFDLDGGGNSSDPLQYSALRVGTDMRYSNPFGQGGQLRFDGEAFFREFDSNSSDGQDLSARLDRFSYLVGGDRDHPQRFEVGRFFQRGLPRLGLLDGAEYARRLDSGDTVGVSLGLTPDRNDTYSFADDVQLAGY